MCAKCPGRCGWAGGWGLAVLVRAIGLPDVPGGWKAGAGCPLPEAGCHLASHAVTEPGAGVLTRWVAHCRYEHAGQFFASDRDPRAARVLQVRA